VVLGSPTVTTAVSITPDSVSTPVAVNGPTVDVVTKVLPLEPPAWLEVGVGSGFMEATNQGDSFSVVQGDDLWVFFIVSAAFDDTGYDRFFWPRGTEYGWAVYGPNTRLDAIRYGFQWAPSQFSATNLAFGTGGDYQRQWMAFKVVHTDVGNPGTSVTVYWAHFNGSMEESDYSWNTGETDTTWVAGKVPGPITSDKDPFVGSTSSSDPDHTRIARVLTKVNDSVVGDYYPGGTELGSITWSGPSGTTGTEVSGGGDGVAWGSGTTHVATYCSVPTPTITTAMSLTADSVATPVVVQAATSSAEVSITSGVIATPVVLTTPTLYGLATIRPDGDGTQAAGWLGSWADIDDDPDTPNDGDYVTTVPASASYYTLTDAGDGFDVMTQVTYKIRLGGTGGDASGTVYVQIVQDDESTALTDEVQAAVRSGDTPGTYTADFTGVVGGNEALWDGARLKVRIV
jgi:hypothetical protein